MISLRSGLHALGIWAAIALAAGCGGGPNTIGVATAEQPEGSLPHHRTFYYNGKQQRFVVPENVTALQVVMRGGSGSTDVGTATYPGAAAGRGGRVVAIVPVIPGESLFVRVGGEQMKARVDSTVAQTAALTARVATALASAVAARPMCASTVTS